jgi:hypothetical protein
MTAVLPRQYRHVLRAPHAGRLMAGGVTGRLEVGGLSLAIILLVHHATGSFAAGGKAAAACLLFASAARPVQGRVFDRYQPGAALRVIAIVHAAVVAAFAVAAAGGLRAVTAVVFAAATGLTLPALSAFIRLAWTAAADTEATLSSSFALDSVLYEIALTAGPLVVSLLVIGSATWVPLLVLGMLGLTGALVVSGAGTTQPDQPADAGPRPGAGLPPGAGPRPGAGLRAARSRFALAGGVPRLVVLQAFIGLALGGLVVCVPVLAARAGAIDWSGLLLAALFAGSMIGGLWYGARKWTGPAWRRLMIALSSIMLFLVLFRLLPWLPARGAALLFAGLAVAPGLTVVLSLVPRLARRGRTAGAFSWMSFAEPAGAAAGSWLAGLAVSARMLPLALWLPAAGAATALVIAALPWKAVRQR